MSTSSELTISKSLLVDDFCEHSDSLSEFVRALWNR